MVRKECNLTMKYFHMKNKFRTIFFFDSKSTVNKTSADFKSEVKCEREFSEKKKEK